MWDEKSPGGLDRDSFLKFTKQVTPSIGPNYVDVMHAPRSIVGDKRNVKNSGGHRFEGPGIARFPRDIQCDEQRVAAKKCRRKIYQRLVVADSATRWVVSNTGLAVINNGRGAKNAREGRNMRFTMNVGAERLRLF